MPLNRGTARIKILRRPAIIVPGSSYVGPGDLVTFAGWWGMRAYSGAKAGTKCIQVVYADTVQADINSLANGDLDTATLTAGIVTHGAAKLLTMYDQAGTNDMTQATGSAQPVITASSLNTFYGPLYTAANSCTLSTVSAIGSHAVPYSVVAIAKQNTTGSGISQEIFCGDSGSFTGFVSGFNNDGTAGCFNGGSGINVGVTNNTMIAFQFVENTPNSMVVIDGTATNGAGGSQALANISVSLGSLAGGSFLNGTIMEAGYVLSAISGPNQTSLNSNMHAAYGAW